MFGAFRVTVDGNAKALIEMDVRAISIACSCTFRILRLGIKQENICASVARHGVEVFQYLLPDTTEILAYDNVGIDIDQSQFLTIL